MSSAPQPRAILLGISSIICAMLALWELLGRANRSIAFFFSYPSAVASDLATGLLTDGLWYDALVTLFPAALGLITGALAGGAAGLAIIARPALARAVEPVIAALGAFPVFAIAPMTLIWFGLDLQPKIFLAFLSCVFVFLAAAYRGGLSVPPAILDHLAVHGFTARDELLKVRLPYALDWLFAAGRTGANLALLGVFIGEFVASQNGLARVMLNAGALYNVKRVLASAILFTILALLLMGAVNLLYRHRLRILRRVSVPSSSRIGKG